ncbi:MAG: DEAD/DEAH box helicase, partial [Candidatus Dadabacteria bacterium]|nr:DEAD/DEAH box helicase [Candidatus Dadabacteria bacterium]NIQ15104.1 DEAD/DEAH box helicase [Candidatus Dadabacteria bacterium]
MENVKNNSHFSKYLSHASIENLFDLINSGQKRINISGLKGSSGHLLISMLSEIGKYILYVSSSKEKAEANSVNLTAIKGLEIPVYSSKDLNKSRSLFEKQNLEELNRIDSLHKINQTNILCTDIISIFELIAPSDIIQNSVYELKVGNDIERVKLINLLKKLGYTELDFVERKSEFSIRGSVVDIYSVGYNNPYRVEFFGDSINSIREFNTSTQKSVNKVERVKINPASFIIIENNKLNSVLENLNYAAEKNGLTARDKNFLFESIKSNIKINDIEWFTPYFYSKKETILDYFKNDLLIIFDEDFNFESIIQDQEKRFFNSTRIGGKFKDLIPDFKELYISEDQLSERLEKHKIIKLGILNNKTETTIKYDTEKINIEENIIESLSQLINELKSKNYELYIYSYSQSEKEKLKSLLNDNNIDNINYLIGPLDNGFVFNDLKIAFISENDISNKKESKPKNLSKFTDIPSVFITSFSDLKPGDYIVHKEFGIGIFKGLKKLTFNSKQGDFIECEYKDKDKIYVPVEKLKLIQRYIGDSKNPSIEKLGSDNWKRTVKRVKKAVETIAKDLLELYAKRKMEKGYMFSPRDQIFNEFELAFPYNETRDQAKSIEEVMQDMESEKPMDRLICGDVGFGKTEIALRAAFKASMDGKQVLLLAPTTLLVNQHYQNALKRLSEYPIEVDMLSRFRTKREENEIIKKIENGSLDIIIGTHKLLNSKIIFKNLGLIIIDEEQKFGVKHKEYLRALKSGIDVL